MSSLANIAYRFVYFDVRGAGEVCRLTLVASGAEWQDIRYPMNLAASGFSYGPEFQRDANAGAFDVNMGSLPILQVVQNETDGGNDKNDHNDNNSTISNPPPRLVTNIGQSHSICKFVASQHGDMAGRDGLEWTKIDALYESCRDVKTEWFRSKRKKSFKAVWFSNSDAQRREAKKDEHDDTSQQTTLAECCQRLEKAVAASQKNRELGSPWCMGGPGPTLADVTIYHMLATPKPSVITGSVPSFFDGESELVRQAYKESECPRLFECVSAFGELSSIQDWEMIRPDTFT